MIWITNKTVFNKAKKIIAFSKFKLRLPLISVSVKIKNGGAKFRLKRHMSGRLYTAGELEIVFYELCL